jgi:arginine repressor
MSSSTAALSRTLKNITLTKIRELEKQRKTYAQSKNAVLEAAKKVDDNPRAKIASCSRASRS